MRVDRGDYSWGGIGSRSNEKIAATPISCGLNALDTF